MEEGKLLQKTDTNDLEMVHKLGKATALLEKGDSFSRNSNVISTR